MVWTKAADNRTYRGWTKNSKYNCRSSREKNEPQTVDMHEYQKRLDAEIKKAKDVEDRIFRTEDANRRATASIESTGTIVKVIAESLGVSTDGQTKLPTVDYDSYYLVSKNGYCLTKGEIGIYLGPSRVRIRKYISKKLQYVDVVIHQYIFGDKSCFFTRAALQHLEVI